MQQFIYDLIVLFAPSFILGFLHTFIPCEDKAIFFFWSFGISKQPKKSVLILVLYGLGLMAANLIITIITVGISITPRLVIPGFTMDPYFLSFLGALTSAIAAVILFVFITKSNYTQKIHSRYKDEIVRLNWEKMRTPFVFGIIVGFAPCVFEFFIYYKCLTLALTYDFFWVITYMFYFSLGTFIGLFPLALAKHSTSQIRSTEEQSRSVVYLIMILVIIVFNIIIMFVSIFKVNIFPGLL
jgi:sulfite exporter TauE/SafE